MKPGVTGARGELGAALLARHDLPPASQVRFDLSGLAANTLLHDGHAWKDFARTAPAGTRRALRAAAQEGASILVRASFAFARELPSRDPLRSMALAALECEAIAREGAVPACIVRLGYLYGPASRDLLAYRKAFRLGRPYWSGPRGVLQDHLHLGDAAAALVAAAKPAHAGRRFYATDGRPRSFREFMDHFARRNGRRFPLHLPRLAKPLMLAVVCEEHMQQVEHGRPARAPRPQVPGWRPAHADALAALDAIVAGWG